MPREWATLQEKYLIQEKIGCGANGQVYIAKHRRSETMVAIKH